MSGAEPCTGSNIDGPVRAGLRLADDASPMPPTDRAAEVGEDVAEQVVGDDHVVAMRVLRRSRCRPRRRGCTPWPTCGYSAATSLNVRCHRSPANVSTLVLCTSVTCSARSRPARQLERVADAALDAHPCVDRALRGDLVRRALAQHAALADVRALGVLADDDEVVRLGATGRGAGERPLVDVEVEVEAHLQQQPALDDARRHLGRADRAEQDGVEARAARRASRRTGSRRRGGSARRRGRSRWCRGRRRRRAPPSRASAVTSGPMPSPPITAMSMCVMGGDPRGIP